jgi:hypothetical protein
MRPNKRSDEPKIVENHMKKPGAEGVSVEMPGPSQRCVPRALTSAFLKSLNWGIQM